MKLVSGKAGKMAMLIHVAKHNIDAVFIYDKDAETFKVLLFPRKEKSYTAKDGYVKVLGAPEMTGLLIIGKQAGRGFYDQLDEREVSEMLRSVSVPAGELEYLSDFLSRGIRYEQVLQRLNTGQISNSALSDMYSGIFDSFMQLEPGITILDTERIKRYKQAFMEVGDDGRPLPCATDIHTAFIDFTAASNGLAELLNAVSDEVIASLDKEVKYYKVEPRFYHISLTVLQDLGLDSAVAPDLFDNANTRLTSQEREDLINILSDISQGVEPFTLTLERVVMGVDGTVFAAFKDQKNQVARIRNEFYARAKRYFEDKGLPSKISERKRPKDIIAVSLIRLLSDISPEALYKLQQLFPKWQNFDTHQYSLNVDSISVAHETKWMHYAYSDKEILKLGIKTLSAGKESNVDTPALGKKKWDNMKNFLALSSTIEFQGINNKQLQAILSAA